jgi:hypothetical protein
MNVTRLLVAVAVLLLLGCRTDQAQLAEMLKQKLAIGQSRADIERILGAWGKAHYWDTESSKVPQGSTDEQQRPFLLNYKFFFSQLTPTNVLETMPLANGATICVRYVYNRETVFAAGYRFSYFMVFYEAHTAKMIGYGIGKRFAGRPDLADCKLFY